MKHILKYNQIFGFSQLNENVQGAKAYMKKKYAKEKSISPNAMTDADVQKALHDPSFIAVIKLTEKTPGYALPFLKFAIEHKVPINGRATGQIGNISMLMNWIQKNPSLVSKLPQKIEEYANHEKIDGVGGFEKLGDDIRTVERDMSVKWLVDSLPIKPRNEYKNLPFKEKHELVNIGISLNDLDKEDNDKAITKRLLSKIKRMSDYSIQEVTDYISNYVKGYSVANLDGKLEQIRELSPGAGILYNDFPYLALSIRTEKAQKKLCSVANWCINAGLFRSYAGNAVQINIFNYSLPASNPMFLTGTTISYEGNVNTSHDINDALLKKSDSPKEQFLSMGYPVNVVNELTKSIEKEIPIKKLLTELIKTMPSKVDDIYGVFLSHILGLADQSLQGKMGDSEWADVISTVVHVLDDLNQSFEPKLIEFLEEYGIFTQSGLKVLEDILKARLSKSQADKIYTSSVETFDEIKRLYAYKINRDDGNPSLIARLKKILDGRDKILSAIK